MADEAVLRIIMQDGGGAGAAPSTAPSASAPGVPCPYTPTQPQPVAQQPLPARQRSAPSAPLSDSGGFDPVELARKRIEREDQQAQVDVEYARLKPAPLPSLPPAKVDPVELARKRIERETLQTLVDAEYAKLKPPPIQPLFDPVEAAKKRIEREDQLAAVDAEYAKLRPTPPEPPFDPVAEAHKRLEADKKRAAIDAEYAKLVPPKPPFDPVAEAKKRLEADKRRAEIDAEYAKLNPPPPFDPQVEASKIREKERQRAQIDEAYKEKYGGGKKETKLDQILSVADSLRGTIGGVFGTLIGSALDVVSGVRKAQAKAAEENRRRELLSGAQPPDRASGTSGSITGAAEGVMEGAAVAEVGTAAASAASPLTILAVAAVAAVVAFKALTRELDNVADRYGEYNPQIAQAQAIVEIRNTLGDFRRAQEVSSEMAKYVLARSDLQQKWEDIKIKLLQQLIPVVTGILKAIEVVMTVGEPIVDVIAALFEPLKVIAEAAAAIENLWRERNMPDIEDPTEQILNNQNFAEGGAWVPQL